MCGKITADHIEASSHAEPQESPLNTCVHLNSLLNRLAIHRTNPDLCTLTKSSLQKSFGHRMINPSLHTFTHKITNRSAKKPLWLHQSPRTCNSRICQGLMQLLKFATSDSDFSYVIARYKFPPPLKTASRYPDRVAEAGNGHRRYVNMDVSSLVLDSWRWGIFLYPSFAICFIILIIFFDLPPWAGPHRRKHSSNSNKSSHPDVRRTQVQRGTFVS